MPPGSAVPSDCEPLGAPLTPNQTRFQGLMYGGFEREPRLSAGNTRRRPSGHRMRGEMAEDRYMRFGRGRSAWGRLWRGRAAGPGVALSLLLLTLGLIGGFLLLTRHRQPTPFSMSADTQPRLPNGHRPQNAGITIASAIAQQPRQPTSIHGYFLWSDDGPYLCTRLNDYADCRGAPRLRIAENPNSRWLLNHIKGLESGCCSIGSWTRSPLILRGAVRRHTLFLAAPSSS